MLVHTQQHQKKEELRQKYHHRVRRPFQMVALSLGCNVPVRFSCSSIAGA